MMERQRIHTRRKQLNKLVITGQSDLFRMNLDGPEYLHGIGVQDVMFLDPRDTNVTLVACTPSAITILMCISDDTTLEIVNRDHGLRKEYTVEDVIIRMRHCEFHEKWFQNLVPVHVGDSEQMMLHANVTCELEVLLDR